MHCNVYLDVYLDNEYCSLALQSQLFFFLKSNYEGSFL